MEQVGVRQQEVLRRVVARNPHPTTESLILHATPAGRGLTEADLAGIPGDELPAKELLRVAISAIADKLVSKGIPPDLEPPKGSQRKRGYVLAGDPLAANSIRAELIGRGRRPGGKGSRAWVLAGPLDELLAHAWTAACFDSGPQPWPQWLATWAHRGKPPTRADLVTIARKHRDAGRKPTIVTDPGLLPAALGVTGPLPAPLELSAPVAEVARRVAIVLGGLVSVDERRSLLRTQLMPRVVGARGPRLAVPESQGEYAVAQADAMRQQLSDDGYPVIGQLADLAPGPTGDASALAEELVLDAAVSMLASRLPVVPYEPPAARAAEPGLRHTRKGRSE